jgi:hypothetical protein
LMPECKGSGGVEILAVGAEIKSDGDCKTTMYDMK